MDDLKQAAAPVRARPFVWFIRFALSGLVLFVLATLVGGIAAVAWELRRLVAEDVEFVLRHVLIGIVILLAVVEVFKTSLACLTEGRVKGDLHRRHHSRRDVDGDHFALARGGDGKAFALLLTVLAALGGMRVLAVRFSPSRPPAGGEMPVGQREA